MRIDRSRKGSIDNSVYYLIKGVTEIKYGLLLQMPSDQSRSSAVNWVIAGVVASNRGGIKLVDGLFDGLTTNV